MANSMAKVRKKLFIDSIMLNTLKGKFFHCNGNIYEGECKDNKAHGQGKKIDLLIQTLFNTLTGKFFCNNGDRYEGEFKDNNAHGQGKKIDLLNDLLILLLIKIKK